MTLDTKLIASCAPVLVRASAGSGKTFALSTRYISLLAQGVSPEQILATTFTRKAAAEIKDRVFKRLIEAAENKAVAQQLAAEINRPDFSQGKAQELLRTLVNAQHRLSILTLDSFFVGIAKSFAAEIGLPYGWKLGGAPDPIRRAISAICRGSSVADIAALLRQLNHGQAKHGVVRQLEVELEEGREIFRESGAKAWNWIKPPERLKAMVIAETLAKLIALSVPTTKQGKPNKHWGEQKLSLVSMVKSERWSDLLEHGLIAALISGKLSYYSLPIDAEWESVLQPLLRQAKAIALEKLANETSSTYELLKSYDQARTSPQNLAESTFDDISWLLARAALTEQGSELYYRLDSRFHHILLDEFQDTSAIQWAVLTPLADELLAKAGEEHSFFCVGDVKQAIYGWRGGQAEILDSLSSTWRQLIELPTSTTRRLAPTLVDFVNRIFGRLAISEMLAEFPAVVKTWTVWWAPHEAHRSSKQSDNNLRKPGYVKISWVRDSSEGAEENGAPSLAEACQIIAEISKQSPDSTVGVLFRRNETLCTFAEELRRRLPWLPFSQEGVSPLAESHAVQSVLALLRYLDHPADTISRHHILITKLKSFLNGPEDLHIAARKKVSRDGLGSFIYEAARRLSEREPLAGDLKQLVEAAWIYEREYPEPLTNFGLFIAFVERAQSENQNVARVRLMTVHRSKGLEFDAVVLPELDNSIKRQLRTSLLTLRETPLAAPYKVARYAHTALRRLDPDLEQMHAAFVDQAIKESLALLYVALTRAKDALYLLCGAKPGTKSFSYSRFIQEGLGEDLKLGQEFELGDPKWWRKSEVTAQVISNREDISHISLKNEIGPGRNLERLKPSSEVESSEIDITQLFSPQRWERLQRGKEIHAALEKIEWLDGKSTIANDLLAGALKSDALRRLLEKKAYGNKNVAVFRELEFSVIVDDRDSKSKAHRKAMSYGKIDRLVIESEDGNPSGAHIIDFKTDAVKPEEIEAKAVRYRRQLDRYREAVCKLTGLADRQVRVSLAFTEAGIVKDY